MSTDSNDPADRATDRDRPDVARLAAHAAASPGSSGSTKALLGILLAGTAGMVIFLFVHLSKDGRIHPGPSQAHAECTKGQRDCLPDVNYIDTTGVAYSHDSLAGKVVLVNFWATWCHPCQQEIPDLSKAYDKYKAKGVVFLGVLTDTPDSQQLLNFQSDHEMTYPIVRANSDLMVSYDYPQSLPTTLVFDRSGKQVLKHIGALRESDLDSLLGQLVAQN
jgi:thiol-disulfide isomerase/thioredoxin